MARKKTSVSFSKETIQFIDAFPSRYHGEKGFSPRAEEIVNDYAALLARAKRKLAAGFSESEMNYLYDLLNSTIMDTRFPVGLTLAAEVEDADKYDGLGAKWGIYAAELAKKISALPEFEAYVLIKMSDEYWAKQDGSDS